MPTPEQTLVTIPINYYDAVIITQMIEKLLRNGLVTGRELAAVASLRMKILRMVKQDIGVDLDNPGEQTEVEAKDVE